MSEGFIKKILRQITPVFKELDTQSKVLDFLSPQSFWFKHYINEDNFCIKLCDYGLSSIYVDQHYHRNYLTLETPLGSVSSQKLNVLSLGLVIYRMVFGENLYNFRENEDPEETMRKRNFNITQTNSTRLKFRSRFLLK